VKLFEQQKIINQGKRARATFWQRPTLREGANKLEKNSAYRQIVDDGISRSSSMTSSPIPIDQHDWMLNSLARSQGAIASKLSNGLALLATVGSTAPFVGLFGTVVGIYRALIKIGAAGQASIDAVAGPVGEALIMTALGLAVAVPAVLGLQLAAAPQQAVLEEAGPLHQRPSRLHDVGGAVKPVTATPGRTGAPSGPPAPPPPAAPPARPATPLPRRSRPVTRREQCSRRSPDMEYSRFR
jgi:biopolymer transport protein ExbB